MVLRFSGVLWRYFQVFLMSICCIFGNFFVFSIFFVVFSGICVVLFGDFLGFILAFCFVIFGVRWGAYFGQYFGFLGYFGLFFYFF